MQRMTTMEKRRTNKTLTRNNGNVLPDRFSSLQLYEPFIPNGTANDIGMLQIYRVKRKVTQEQKDICNDLAISSKVTSGIGGMVDTVGSFLGPIGSAISAGVVGVLQLATFGTDIASLSLDCSSLPFDELKDTMNEGFDALDKAVNRNYELLKEVGKIASKTLSTVEQTRIEMHQGFDLIRELTKELTIRPMLSEMKAFIRYFDQQKERFSIMSEEKYFNKINDTYKDLENLEKLKTPAGKSLTILYDMIDKEFTSPADSHQFMMLNAIYYGIQTYYSVLFFLIEQYSMIASYHYKNGDLDNYNVYFEKIDNTFIAFKGALTGDNLIAQAIGKLEAFQKNEFISENQKNEILLQITELEEKKNELTNMNLPFITVEPKLFLDDPVENRTNYAIPIRQQNDNKQVSYAIQYADGDQYSKIGTWSKKIDITDEMVLTIRIPKCKEKWTRIIFRKFPNIPPEIVGVITKRRQVKFLDINRDIYNAALGNKTEMFNILISSNGADPKAVFEEGRSAIHAAAKGKSLKIIKKLVTVYSSDINSRDNNGYTPLHVASEAGHKGNFIEKLLENGADVNARTNFDKLTPLHIAVKKDYIPTVKALLNCKKIDVNLGDTYDYTPLHFAVSVHSDMIKALLGHKSVDVNAISKSKVTPLHLAVIHNNTDIANEILKNIHVKVDAQSDGDLTALNYAIIAGKAEMVNLLKKKKANVNVQDKNGMTPLHFAVSLNRLNVTRALLNGRIDVNSKDKNNVTALHIAVGTNPLEIVKTLLQRGANVNVATKDGLTPLHIAVMARRKEMVEILAPKSKPSLDATTKNGTTPLLAACQREALDIAKYLIDKGADIKAEDNSNNNALQISVKSGQLELVKYIIYVEESIEALITAMQFAIAYGHLHIVQYLVEETYLDAFCRYSHQFCPLSEACKFNYLPVVEYLFKIVGNNYNLTPLENALRYGHLNIFEYLMKQFVGNALISRQNLLHKAAKYGWYDIVKYLVEISGIQMEVSQDGQKISPLHLAAASGNLDLLKYLINLNNLKPASIDAARNTVLHYAIDGIKENNLDETKASSIIKYLIDELRVVAIDTKNYQKETPLHRAVIHDLLYVAELLVSRGAKVNIRITTAANNIEMQEFLEMQLICNDIEKQNIYEPYAFSRLLSEYNVNARCIKGRDPGDKSTALHVAISNNAIDLANAIIERNADLNMKDKQGKTPLQLAVEKGRVDLIKKLIKYGADVTIKNPYGDTPESWAKRYKQKNIVELFQLLHNNSMLWSGVQQDGNSSVEQLDRLKGDPCEENINGYTLIHLAAAEGYTDVLKYLIRKNCSVNSMNKFGQTPLYLATLNGHTDAIQVLLDNGADINNTNFCAENGIIFSTNIDKKILVYCRGVTCANNYVIKIFVNERYYNYKEKDTSRIEYLLFKYVKEADEMLVREKIENHSAAINSLYRGIPPLGDACITGRLNVVKHLIEKGADPTMKSVFGCTPLHWAVFGRNLDIASYLVEKNQIDINAVDAGGRTALHYSAMYGTENIVKYFIDTRRLDINLKDNKGNTVLHLATQWNNTVTLNYLIGKTNALRKTKNSYGSTPLHIAAVNGYTEVLKILVANGAQIDELDNKGRSSLVVAAEYGNWESLKFLLHEKFNDKPYEVDQLFEIATKNRHFDVAENLRELVTLGFGNQRFPSYVAPSCYLTRHGLMELPTSSYQSPPIPYLTSFCLTSNLHLLYAICSAYCWRYKLSLQDQYEYPPTVFEIMDEVENLVRNSTQNPDEIIDSVEFYKLYVNIEANIKMDAYPEIPSLIGEFFINACPSQDASDIRQIFKVFENRFL